MASLPLPFAAFLAGLLSFLSPCVLPLVPGYLSMISGISVQELRRQEPRTKRAVMYHAIMFAIGFSLVFIALGAAASSLGQIAGRHMALLSKVAGIIIIIFGLHLTGITPIRVLYSDKRLAGASGNGSASRTLVMGFAFGFAWTPCVGPILAGILALAASEATLQKGITFLGLYSLGLALPFLATSLGVDRFLSAYGRIRPHLRMIEVISGSLMIVVGILVFTRHLTTINSWLNDIPFVRRAADLFL
jgi:cytochrome c-type biogenesis protein